MMVTCVIFPNASHHLTPSMTPFFGPKPFVIIAITISPYSSSMTPYFSLILNLTIIFPHRVKERCQCKFHWCCYVECKTCTKSVQLTVCK